MTVMAAEAAQRARAAAKARRAALRERAVSAPERAINAAPETGAAYGRQARQTAQQAQIVPGNRNYQGIILAEFLVAMLLVTLSPIASGGSPNAKAKNSPSPYDSNDLKQLVAVGGTYFSLALLSSGNRGRLAAWLGGLILIAIAMSKAGQGKLAGIFTVVAPQPSTEPAPGTSTV